MNVQALIDAFSQNAGLLLFLNGTALIFLSAILLALHSRLRVFFQCDDGQLSMTRLLMFVLCVSYDYYAGYIAYMTKTLPDLPWGMMFLLGWLYTANKVPFSEMIAKSADLIKSIKGGPQ